MLSLPLIFATFGIIFIAELPDKTAIAALILSTRYRARDVIVGAWLAFLVQTIISVAAGSVLTLLPTEPVRIASGVGFLVFSFFAFRREEKYPEKQSDNQAPTKPQRPIWLLSFFVIFAAEWVDLTQLATSALVARNGHPVAVGIGAVLALWTATVLAA